VQQQQQQQQSPVGVRKAFLPPWLLAGAQVISAQQQQQQQQGLQLPTAVQHPQQQQQHGVQSAVATATVVSQPLTHSSTQVSRASSSNSLDAASAAAGGSGAAVGGLRRPCQVCMEAESAVLLMPCKHMVMCKECADAIQAEAARLPAWDKPFCPKANCTARITSYVVVIHS